MGKGTGMWDNLFGSVDLLHSGLEASWLRNAVIRNNIANVETPGFKAGDVNFESVYRAALESAGAAQTPKRTRDRHIKFGEYSGSGSPLVTTRRDLSMRLDENNVDIESENVKLAQNSILYNTIVSELNGELSRLKTAISG
ncbi:MAG: flagellar basal body rod protein FlgB [Oscillospiraceae bacterium]|jgi:flagellar basal-body rod protein FlgB|nr:flagellar basal body rod protein FlgB [Oscillospiraceae bacterium]